MSRIIVKNLPSVGINENELKKHFLDIDTITDIKLKTNDYGHSRRFAFVGFKNQDAAEKAIEKLNNSFIRNSKISLELCKQIKDIKPALVKKTDSNNEISNKNDFKEERLTKRLKTSNNSKKVVQEVEQQFEEMQNDPKFSEFVSLQRNLDQNIKSDNIWSDDVKFNANSKGTPATQETQQQEGEEKKKKHKRSRGKKKPVDKSKPKELFVNTIKVQGFPDGTKRKNVKDFFKPLELISIRQCKRDGVCYVSFKNEQDLRFALRKNQHFCGTSRVKILKHNIKNSRAFQETMVLKREKKEEEFKKYEASSSEMEAIEESGRLFVRNLNYTCTMEDLEQVFSKYGQITEIHFPIDKKTNLPKGYAFVEFMFPQNAKSAYEELNGTIFQGRNFHLIASKPKPELSASQQASRLFNPSNDRNKSSFKQSKAEEHLKEASKLPQVQQQEQVQSQQSSKSSSPPSWNILFLGQNAVADVGAEAKSMEKSEFLTSQSNKDPIAVRMALADASIVEETRKFLVSNGIELNSFDDKNNARSRTVILAKNLPSNVNKEELSQVFGKFGAVSRILLPPKGLTAIVEMDEPNDAKNAFRNLSYSKFKDNILYLEWAPINVFREKSLDDEDRKDVDELRKQQTGTKIVVKNVAFEATEKEVRKIFSAFGEINFIRFVKKVDGQHRGFCFVDYLTREDALRAFAAIRHSTHLYGRRLVLEWAKVDEIVAAKAE